MSSRLRTLRCHWMLLICSSMALMLGGCASAGANSSQTPLPTRPIPPHSSITPIPSPPVADPWLAYLTDVDPGSAGQFVSATTGWRIDGQDGVPHLDMRLAAGPHGASLAWPGSSVSKSTDGGVTWTSVFTTPDGIWSLDLVSETTGWVIGVTSAARTSDGGKTWKSIREPASGKLVRVDFASATDGLGLTTSGGLVRISDGGNSWRDVAKAPAGTALCFSSPQSGFVTDGEGNVWATHDSAQTWHQVRLSPYAGQNGNVWASISCNGGGVWVGLRLVNAAVSHGQSYAVLSGTSDGTSWAVAASNSKSAGVHAAVPKLLGLSPVGTSNQAVLVGVDPTTDNGLRIAGTTGSSRQFSHALTPDLDAGSEHGALGAAAFAHLDGITVVGQRGWMLVNDTGLGSGQSPQVETIVLRTEDG
ncbi:MAG: WD40/YVTN/BNR-like repeat-containing protein, partial [Dehalococcoidia bacterium]